MFIEAVKIVKKEGKTECKFWDFPQGKSDEDWKFWGFILSQ